MRLRDGGGDCEGGVRYFYVICEGELETRSEVF